MEPTGDQMFKRKDTFFSLKPQQLEMSSDLESSFVVNSYLFP